MTGGVEVGVVEEVEVGVVEEVEVGVWRLHLEQEQEQEQQLDFQNPSFQSEF